MGGCANSKYAVDEDKQPKSKEKKVKDKKNKKKGDQEAVQANGDAKQHDAADAAAKGEKEGEIEFIDKEEAEKQQQAAVKLNDDDVKKEVTTYQTTVVKHSQKEGEELMQHLKDEAFKTLLHLLKQQQQSGDQSDAATTTTTTTASSPASAEPQTSTTAPNEDVVEQIKTQVVNSLGKTRQAFIESVIDSGVELIKEGKVKNMNELQEALEAKYPNTTDNKDNNEFIKKIINGTTGFLTAKGTEAGALLSSILANVSNGLQGVMNETEKTTVKVTRTITEQLMSGGQIKEITKVITKTEPTVTVNPNINEILKNLTSGSSSDDATNVTNTGDISTVVTSVVVEKLENAPKADDLATQKQAEQVVTTVVTAAVEKVIDEERSTSPTGEKLTNGHGDEEPNKRKSLETATNDIQSEFFKHGKEKAEEEFNKLTSEAPATTA